MKKILFLLIITYFIPIYAFSQEEYKKYPGFVDLSDIEEFKNSEESVEIFISKPLLSLVALATSGEDPALHNLLKKLVLIRVDQFTVKNKEAKEVKSLIKRISNKLKKEKWSTIVKVKEANELVEILIKNEGQAVAGLLIMTLEPNKEAVFVNIVGNLDIEQLGKLSKKFNIPKLDSLSTKQNNKLRNSN